MLPALGLDGQNRQSPIASIQRTQSTLASHSAVPSGMNTTPTNANCAIRIAVQRTQGLQGPNSVFLWGRYERQRTLVIRIAAKTLASDSAVTIAQFRPSKLSVETSVSPLPQMRMIRTWFVTTSPRGHAALEEENVPK